MNFPQFQAKWLNPSGQRVDYDHKYEFQCIDLIRQYCYEVFGIGDGAGGVAYAINYWDSTPGGMLSKFTRLGTTQVAAGDIVVLSDRVPGDARTSHIMIATGNQSVSDFEGMEQNGSTGNASGTGPDAIRTRYVAKNRIAGVLRPEAVASPPAVPMITLDQLAQLYRSILEREPDVSGIQHYVGHYTYDFVANDMANSAEHRQAEANKAAAAAAAAQVAAIEAARQAAVAQQAAHTAPAAPVQVPTSTEKYPIRTTIDTYGSKTDAINRTNPKSHIYEGRTWYKYYEKDGMLNITQEPGTTSGTWINPADNVVPIPAPEPAPEPVKEPELKPAPRVETEADVRASFLPVLPDGSAVECDLLQTVMVVDALGYGAPITAAVSKQKSVKVYGTFEAAGHVFAAVGVKDKNISDGYMYGINIAARDNFKPYLSDPYTLNDHIRKSWELLYDKAGPTIEGIFRAFRVFKKKK